MNKLCDERTYEICVKLKPLSKALEDASNQICVVEESQRNQKNVEGISHRFSTLTKKRKKKRNVSCHFRFQVDIIVAML